jgi:hypothetical protein
MVTVSLTFLKVTDMKTIRKITSIVVAVAMIFMVACDPIEDRDVLKNSFNPDDIELEVTQTAGGTGNGVTLKMKTPGVTGWWDYLIDKKNTDEVYVVFPIPGTHTFTYTVSTPYITGGDPSNREVITKSIEVTIDVLDQPLPQDYYDLIGEDLTEKTWIFDRASTNWWYMSPPDGNAAGVWWNASDCCAPGDQGGKMVFDLDGGANYTYYPDAAGAAAGTGTFSFNGSFNKLTIGGTVNILGAEGTVGVNGCAVSVNTPKGQFEIKELTANKLVLYIPDGGCGSGWTWIFVPAP